MNIGVQCNMKQLVGVPTRETLNTSSLLDVIFTTNYQSHTTTGVYTLGLSDRYMIFNVYSSVRNRNGHHDKYYSLETTKQILLDVSWMIYYPSSVYMTQFGVLVYSNPNGMNLRMCLLS